MLKFQLYTPTNAHIAVFWIIISSSGHKSSEKLTTLCFRFEVNMYILLFEPKHQVELNIHILDFWFIPSLISTYRVA
jgi:hypothetical protein